MCLCSWANIIASSRWSLPVRNLVQNARMDDGDARSHCSAYISSLEVVERRRSIRIATFGDSIGSGERAMICAPRWARDWRSVRPNGVKPP